MDGICFIEAKSPGAHVFSAYPIPRLGTVLLATILKEQGYRTAVFIEDIAKPDWKAIEGFPIVGISTITSTATRAYKLADSLRAKGKTVIMGGPHVTFMPDEALLHSDFVVRGEGEDSLPELLKALKEGDRLDDIKGLSYKTPTGNVHNPARELISDLGRHPAPDFSLVHGWTTKKSIIPVATSRGCPFACSFCSVIQMFGRKYRFKGVERIIEELKSVVDRKNSFVFFIDDNFTADRKRTKELLRRIIAEGIRFEWGAQVRSDAAKDPELLKLMKEAGCLQVYIGFESINPKTLEAYNKKQGIEDIIHAISSFKRHGIRVHGMFVFGSDTDDVETIRGTGRFARKQGIESVQFLILTPLPGTPVFTELCESGRVLHTEWNKYDAHHTVFSPALMSPSELQRETFKAMAKFYSWRTILKHLARLNLYSCVVGVYGRRAVKKASRDSEKYLGYLSRLEGVGLAACRGMGETGALKP